MKHPLFGICLGFLIAVFNHCSAFAKDPITSAEQLRSEFETALKAEDTNAIASLYDWQGVSDESKSGQIGNIASLLSGGKIESVKLTPLSSDYSDEDDMETDDGLVIIHKNLAAIGLIEVKSQPTDTNDSPMDMEIPYGKTNNAFCFSAVVTEKIPRAALKEKSLNIIVATSPESTTFTGSCIYIKNGKEVKADINGNTNVFRGGYVKSCTVQKTSDQGWIKLKISENDRIVFDNGIEETKTPVTYEIPKFEP